MKRLFKYRLDLQDSDIQKLKDAGKVTKLKVKIEATHSGIVNKNFFFYTPAGMSDGADSFIEPYNKPVHLNHETDTDPVGRVIGSKYIDYADLKGGTIDTIKDTTSPSEIVEEVALFVKGNEFNDSSYKGLGHIELIAEITDEEAIEKILDKRYLTVSIGGNVDSAICSVCGTDQQAEDSECEHWRGETYDGKTAFLIGGLMDFSEVSYVSTPADTNAVSEVVNDSNESEYIRHTLEILDYEVDKGEHPIMKKKLAEILKQANLVKDSLKNLGLESLALNDEAYDKLRKSSFLFANDKALPINDKAHVLVALHVLDQVEECEDSKQALEVLDRKFKKLFGDVSVEDAIKSLAPAQDTPAVNSPEVPVMDAAVLAAALAPLLTDTVTDAVMSKLQDSVSVDDSFHANRAEALEAENDSLEQENKLLTDRYKSVIINQILVSENKIDDKDYEAKLQSRGLDSLADKLDDLGFGNLAADINDADNVDQKPEDLEDNVNIDDASDNAGNIEDNVDPVEGDKPEAVIEDSSNVPGLTIDAVRAEYKNVFKTKGGVAARSYLKELSDSKTIPDNFTF
jgi:hypothetical protein